MPNYGLKMLIKPRFSQFPIIYISKFSDVNGKGYPPEYFCILKMNVVRIKVSGY
jgi:hypothetical protein